MQFSSLATVASLSAYASAAAYQNGTVVTVDVTVTGYTTYCPEPTTITVTVCEESDICKPTEIEVTEAKTVTITEECIIPTSYTTNEITITKTICEEEECVTVAPTKAAPAESQPAAVESKAAPVKSQPAAVESKAAPAETKPAAVESKAAPAETAAPTVAAPAKSAPLEIDTTSTVYQDVTSYEGAGVKNAAGVAAGLVAIAAALL